MIIREIISVEMSNNEIYQVELGKLIRVVADSDDEGFNVLEGEEEINWFLNESDAEKAALAWAMDDDLIVKGFGEHSGKKLWQLPDSIRDQIFQIAAE